MDIEQQERREKKKKYNHSPQIKKKKKHSRSRSERKKDKDKKHHSRSRDKKYDREKKDNRDNQDAEQRKKKDKYERYQRESHRDHRKDYNNDRDHKNKKKKDYFRRDDRDRYRFDSPPKSDESDMSQDPQKVNKLNQMKAAKQLVSTKADRKLYLGNLPPNITSNQLMEMLNSALKKMDINTESDGDSIISAWISPDGVGHYAFVEFRSAQEATNGLTLNGASLYGYQLKLGRPKQYIQYNKQLLSQIGTDGNMDGILKKVAAMGPQIPDKVQQKIICPPSRILILKHILTIQQLAIDEEYQEIVQDLKDMGQRYGEVINVIIPRPHQIINIEQAPKRVKGLGYAFIQYKTVEQAMKARKQLIKKMFSERSVTCGYFDQNRYKQGEYDVQQKIVINF